METMLDQLKEIIEERVHTLLRKVNEVDKMTSQVQKLEYMERIDAIMNQLAEEEREWLDNQLLSQEVLLNDKAESIYKAGFCDSLKLMKLLGI